MKPAAFYLKQLKQAAKHHVPGDVIAYLKDCHEMATALEMANKQALEADGMTIVREAVKEMREND